MYNISHGYVQGERVKKDGGGSQTHAHTDTDAVAPANRGRILRVLLATGSGRIICSCRRRIAPQYDVEVGSARSRSKMHDAKPGWPPLQGAILVVGTAGLKAQLRWFQVTIELTQLMIRQMPFNIAIPDGFGKPQHAHHKCEYLTQPRPAIS